MHDIKLTEEVYTWQDWLREKANPAYKAFWWFGSTFCPDCVPDPDPRDFPMDLGLWIDQYTVPQGLTEEDITEPLQCEHCGAWIFPRA